MGLGSTFGNTPNNAIIALRQLLWNVYLENSIALRAMNLLRALSVYLVYEDKKSRVKQKSFKRNIILKNKSTNFG